MNSMMGSAGVMASLGGLGPLIVLWTLLWLAVLDLAMVAFFRLFPGGKTPMV